MQTLEIIPAIDIIDGKCVRLTKGDYATKKIYNEDPLEVARMFEDNGIKRLHVVDLDGAKAKHIINHETLRKITNGTKLVVDFGGGLKSVEDLKIAFDSGAAMVTAGSIAAKEPETVYDWIRTHGADKIILGADVNDRKIAVNGWQESTTLDVFDFIAAYREKGIYKVISTDISKDGMLQGTSVELYKDILAKFPDLYLIASGGVSSVADLDELIEHRIPAVIVGKAFYEGRISMADLARFI